ncbi:MAG: RNA degradosome polyphosphate kinase [Hyphomonadaceae bacterium]
MRGDEGASGDERRGPVKKAGGRKTGRKTGPKRTTRPKRVRPPARITAKPPTGADPAAIEALMGSSERFFNRELSWLKFNMRVLEEAENANHPLFERLRFLSISATNLDEFYMVRVAGLRQLVRKGVTRLSQDGLTPRQQVDQIAAEATDLMRQQQRTWKELRVLLAQAGIAVLQRDELTDEDRDLLRQRFMQEVFPVLTPQAIDPAHPFPFIPNQQFAVAFSLTQHDGGAHLYALVPLPTYVPRFMELPEGEGGARRFISLENVISVCQDALFPDCDLNGRCLLRVLRDSDIEIEEEAEDLVREFEVLLKERRRGRVVRLELDSNADPDLRQYFVEALGAEPLDIVEVDGKMSLGELSQLIVDGRSDLVFPTFEPRFPERIREYSGDLFASIRAKDILVHHPYESFDVVLQFLRQAANDPDVVAIKQTLYRTSKNSPIIAALKDAAEAGKNVTALVEIKARFDEEANLKWARDLERSGVHVVYGFIEWKTHAKVSLVIRREQGELRAYTHFGTGNYHPITARIYDDLSLFTADPTLGRDAGRLFNFVTGYSRPTELERIAIAPITLKSTLLELIRAEIAFVRQGRPATIWAKLNALVDPEIIDELYRASQAGVQIRLIVRGICCLRPGVPGLSDNIQVRSIVGRFLEHSRIVCFGNGEEMPSGEAKVFISSADWMPRNLDRRVEALTPILNPTVHRQVLDQIMVANLHDNVQSWTLAQDGGYVRRQVDSGLTKFSAHEYFLENPSLSGRGAALQLTMPPDLKPGT